MHKTVSTIKLWMGLLLLATTALLAGCARAAAADTGDGSEVPIVPQDSRVLAEALVEPARWAELRFDTAGVVAEVVVTAGDVVITGAPLARP